MAEKVQRRVTWLQILIIKYRDSERRPVRGRVDILNLSRKLCDPCASSRPARQASSKSVTFWPQARPIRPREGYRHCLQFKRAYCLFIPERDALWSVM